MSSPQLPSPDYRALADAFANPNPGQVSADTPIAYRRASVVSVQATTPPTVTLALFGSTTPIPGVRYPRGSAPVAGDLAECVRAGAALFVVAILA